MKIYFQIRFRDFYFQSGALWELRSRIPFVKSNKIVYSSFVGTAKQNPIREVQ